MQQAGIFLHSDLGQLLHQPQCFLEEKKLLKCLMQMMKARCFAGLDRRSTPVSFLQAYRHTQSAAVTCWQGRLQPHEVFFRCTLMPYSSVPNIQEPHSLSY